MDEKSTAEEGVVLDKKSELKEKRRKRFRQLKRAIRHFFNLEHDTADYDTIKERISDGGRVTGTNMCVLVLAILIASIGLNMNSTAVIIGAMLISPLMGTILATAYGAASADTKMLTHSLKGFVFQVVFSLLTSTVYFWLSPISTPTAELIARTQPSIWDVMIAIFGGLAGIIGITRKEKSNVIPGVAIATALMPPLCTCGYGIATLQWRFVFGAFYLFLVNSYFIFLSAEIVLTFLRIPRLKEVEPKKLRKVERRMVRNTIIIIIPSLVFAGYLIYDQNVSQNISAKITHNSEDIPAIVEQIEAMYPEVDSVEITAKADTGSNVHYSLTLSSDSELSDKDLQRLHNWLCTVLETDSDKINVNILGVT